MRQIIFFFALLTYFTPAQAQFTGHYNALNVTGSTNTLKSEIPLAEPSVVGSTYLNDDWQSAEIVLKDGFVIDEFPIRVEIEHGNVEIQYHGEVKYLNLSEVNSVKLRNDGQSNGMAIRKANEYAVDGLPLKGIVMVYQGERYGMVKHLYIDFLPANYNVAMDVGSKDHRKVKKVKNYLSIDNKLILIKGPSRKMVNKLGSDREAALVIIKEHKLNLSNEQDLLAFVTLFKSN